MPKLYCEWKDFPGESTDDAHVDWSELMSVDFDMSRMMTMGSGVGGLTRGAVNFSPLSVLKKMDKADPDLIKYSGDGTPLAEVVIEACQDSGAKEVILRLTLTNCVIGGCSFGVSGQEGADAPVVSTTLGYQKIKMEYTNITQEGAVGSTYVKEYDLSTNVGA